MEHVERSLSILLACCVGASAQVTSTISSVSPGGRQTGGVYVVDSAVGLGGYATTSSVTIKSGFAGQLYDVASLQLSVDSTNRNEGAFFAVSSAAGLDDASWLALVASNVVWAASADPLSLFFTPGQYLALNVYQDTAGGVTGSYLGLEGSLGVRVLDSDPDNYTTAPYSFAFDGIPDSWQATNFALGSSDAALTADSDNDGSAALAEYFFNTDPASGASSPSNAIRPTLVTNAGQVYFAVKIHHRQVTPTLAFHPQVVGDLASYGSWTSTPVLELETNGTSGMVTGIYRDVSAATNSSPRFMRVLLEPASD